MNSKYSLIVSFLFVYTLSSCNENKGKRDSLVYIDIEANVKNFEISYLSEVTQNISYIRFGSTGEFNFSRFTNFAISGDLILVAQRGTCVLYDNKGQLIGKIGEKGRGPGEYQFITNIGFGENKNIFLSDMWDLLEYDLNGTLIKKYKKSLLVNDDYSINTWYPLNDSIFLGNIPNSTGMIENKALLVSKTGRIQKSYTNYSLFARERKVNGYFEDFAQIYQYNKQIYFKNLYNDTLFYLNNNQDLIPKYVFNLGNLKEPVSVRASSNKNMFQYVYIWNVFQIENYIFIQCELNSHFPAKRLTPREYPTIPGAKPSMFNTTDALGIYNKLSRRLVFCKPTNTDNPLFTSGLYNDIDAGPRFFPQKQINDSTMVMWVDAKQLKDHVASEDFKNNIPKYPEKKKELENLANSLSEFDNPILMFVTFKY